MLVNRNEWVVRLTKLMSAVGPGTIAGAFSCFLFEGGRISTNNGTFHMETCTSLVPEKDTYVPAAPFLKLLTSLPDEEVELIFEGDLLHVKTKSLNGKLNVAVREEPKEKVEATTEHVISNIKDYLSGMSFCMPAASQDVTTAAMCGVRCTEELVLSSNRFKIFTWAKDNYTSQKFQYTLPVTLIEVLNKFKGEIKSLVLNIGNKTKEVITLTAQLDDATLIEGAPIVGKYEDLKKYFPPEGAKHIDIPINQEFIQSVSRLTVFLSNLLSANKEMFVTVTGDRCELSVHNPDYGRIVEEIFLPIPDETFECSFCVNPTLITDALDTLPGDSPQVSYYSDLHLLVIKSDQSNCCMPTRLTLEKKETKEETNDKQ